MTGYTADEEMEVARICVHILSNLNHGINFLLYIVSGQQFRRQFLEIGRCKSGVKTRSNVKDSSSERSTASDIGTYKDNKF